MADVDPSEPCLIGVGRVTVHPEEGPAPEPLDLWEQVARAALDDAGAPGLAGAVDSVHVVYCQSWEYDDPAGRLCQRLGLAPADRRYTGIGGTVPQVVVAEAAAAIARGELTARLVVMGETGYTVRKAMQAGTPPAWSHRATLPVRFPLEAPLHPAERAHGVMQAWLTFAMRDVARRAARGEQPDQYRAGLGALMSGLTRTAAADPLAWFPTERTPAELADVAPDNRMVGYPYTKRLCSILDVDQAAAVVITSHGEADRLGVPADRRVYLRSAAYAEDPVVVAEHPDLARSPAMATAASTALADAGVRLDDVAHLDLYSCFPASLGFARDALGLAADDPRPLTVTGGLPYAGGPGSGYLVGALAAMVGVLREDPGSVGLVSGVGMHMTKHVYAVYSTTPPTGRTVAPGLHHLGARADGAKPVHTGEEVDGHGATVATYSVVHGRDGEPEHAVVVADVGGARAYAVVTDPGWLAAAESEELVGTAVSLRTDPRGYTVAYA